MSGGMLKRAIRTAFNMPPTQPTSSAAKTAAAMLKCPSRQVTPNTTAASPIMEPTERSMPAVTRMGVKAMAKSPTSTLVRMTSKKFPRVKKFGAMAENTAISAARAHSRMNSLRLCMLWLSKCGYSDGRQNDGALNGLLPVSAQPQERERGADGTQQDHAEH